MSHQECSKNDKGSTAPLRILATFYFQPSWLYGTNDHKKNKVKSNLLIYRDDDDDSEASGFVPQRFPNFIFFSNNYGQFKEVL